MKKNLLFTDMVGYSKLTGKDQQLAIELLSEHDRLIESIIARHDGVIVKRIGDAIVAFFSEPQYVVQCAVDIQASFHTRNKHNIKSRHIVLRIGLHYGEVVQKGEELYGEGYNIGCQIEPLCPNGKIAMSVDIFQNIVKDINIMRDVQRFKLTSNSQVYIRPIGQFKLKGLDRPMSIYKIYLNMVDWFDEDYNNVSQYLIDQNVNYSNFKKIDLLLSKEKIKKLPALADEKYKNFDFSYAIYYYKLFLDTQDSINLEILESKLSIIKIIIKCGLSRRGEVELNKFESLDKDKQFRETIEYLKGLNSFNLEEFSISRFHFENYLSISKDFNIITLEVVLYILIILFNTKEFKIGLDLIDKYKQYYEEYNFQLYKLIKTIFESQLNNSLFPKALSDNKTLSNTLANENYYHNLAVCWFIIQYFKNKNENIFKIQDIARNILENISVMISDNELRELFLSLPHLHENILQDLDFAIVEDYGYDDSSDLDMDSDTEPIEDNTCTECGFEKEGSYSFCPECGHSFIS